MDERIQKYEEKMKKTLKEIQHKPVVRGGNGRPATEAETLLYLSLKHLGFTLETVVKTEHFRHQMNCPPCYKVDVGNNNLKLAIEADGYSHCCLSRQEQDRKKETCLTGLGWTVLRFSNERILTETENVMITIMSTILRLKGTTTM